MSILSHILIRSFSFVTTYIALCFGNCFLLQVNLNKFTWRRKQFLKHCVVLCCAKWKIQYTHILVCEGTEDLHDLHSSSNINQVTKSRTMRWASHVTCRGEISNTWRGLVGIPEGKKHLSIDGTLMVKYIVKKWDGKMWTWLIWHRIQVVGSCTLHSIKHRKFLHWMRNC